LLKNELRQTEQNIKKHEKELSRRFREQSMAPTERKALKDVISALKVVKDRVLKDIHNVQESWRKAAERFKKDVERDRAKKKIKRKTSIAYFMGRKLKTGKFKNWAPATHQTASVKLF